MSDQEVMWKDLVEHPENYWGYYDGIWILDGFFQFDLTGDPYEPCALQFSFAEMDTFLLTALALYGNIELTNSQRQRIIQKLQEKVGNLYKSNSL